MAPITMGTSERQRKREREREEKISVGKDVEKLKPLYTVSWECTIV